MSDKKDKTTPSSGTGQQAGASSATPQPVTPPEQAGGTVPIGVPVSPEEYRKLKEQARKPQAGPQTGLEGDPSAGVTQDDPPESSPPD